MAKRKKRQRRYKVSFRATKIVSKPIKVYFYTKSGRRVEFKATKDVPKSVRVEFLARKKKKKK